MSASLPPLPALRHLGDLAAFEIRYDIPVVWTPTPEAGARMIETWSWYFSREHVEQVNALFRKAAMPAPAPA